MGKLVKKTGLLMLILALVLSFSGCGKKKTADESTKEPEKKVVKEEKKEEPEKEEEMPANLNLLTGLPDLTDGAIGKRPVAVMVNNVPAAMPQ